MTNLTNLSPAEFRRLVRTGDFTSPTNGYCPGYTQANLVIVPQRYAYDFLLLAQRNPRPCPVLEVSDAGALHGNMVVSMRPIPASQVAKAVEVTAAMPRVHGAPIYVGAPASLGINDLFQPDYGDPVTIKDGELPVFWPCGVTPAKRNHAK